MKQLFYVELDDDVVELVDDVIELVADVSEPDVDVDELVDGDVVIVVVVDGAGVLYETYVINMCISKSM
jgi:hypothetical protein